MKTATAQVVQLDMTTPIFSREKINAFIEGFQMLGKGPPTIPRDWTMHVGRATTVTMTFHGPVGADEWDALLAHIAFYKQWYKDEPPTQVLSLKDAVDEVMRRLQEIETAKAANTAT